MRKLLILILLLVPQAQGANVPARIEAEDLLTHQPVSVAIADPTRATVVLFLSSRCPCSASHEERIKELYNEFSPKGFRFIGIHSNQDESPSSARAHFEKAGLPFPVLQDSGAKIANALGALKTPHAYVLSPKGEILFQGGVDDSHIARDAKKFYLKTALSQIEQGQKPDPAEVRVLGCVIER
jgi:peroxiredoxin